MTDQIAQDLKAMMTRLPYISADLPGIGGVIKASPEDFQVEEILPYAPCGEGEHVFIHLRRQGWNTADVARHLRRVFGIGNADIGWAGRKDKNAITTQTFSLLLPIAQTISEIESVLGELPFEILEVQRHRNKLKTGHVAANRFRITLTEVKSDALAGARAIGDEIRRLGLPNYYGQQRFGIAQRNIDQAMALLNRGKARGKKEGFLVSAFQSALFNHWLMDRIERGEFGTILPGDLAKKTDTGGMFVVEDHQEALQRFDNREIIYTGPIYGHKMRCAADLALEHEERLLESFHLEKASFKPLRAPGSRRSAILHLDDLAIEQIATGLQFTFTLPSGAYATTVMREFTRDRTDSTR